MTDVFIAYAREDRDRVRPVAEALQAEGWDVWWDPTQPSGQQGESMDRRLGSAGAVLVVWSGASRGSEYVRSEASTGLYRNKLIQARIDAAAPPRPFDQVEVMDLGHWSGDREDPQWRRIVSTVKLFAGAPGSTRPSVIRRGAAGGTVTYLEPKRSIAVAPMAGLAAVVLAAGGGALWWFDPLHLRAGAAEAASAGAVKAAAASEGTEPAAGALSPDAGGAIQAAATSEVEIAWEKLNRADPRALRGFIERYDRTGEADSARALLRVLDAQAWAGAVTADTADAYNSYLAMFPVDASIPGAMSGGARERLSGLDSERAQAVSDIQRALIQAGLYRGAVDGKPGGETSRGARQFAAARSRAAPDLVNAAPRDLRAFADLIERESRATASPEARAEAAARQAAAEAADRKRIEEAAAASRQAEATAATTAEDLAQAEIKRQAEARAAAEAEAAAAAEAAKPKPPPFSPQLAPEPLRAVIEAARGSAQQAATRAAAARQIATQADQVTNEVGVNGVQEVTAADGDRYVAQVQDGVLTGLGVRTNGDTTSAGDKYRGQMQNGLGSGLGVYEFADNPNNAQAGALRYEGEHQRDAAAGLGVTYWKNGDRFAGTSTTGISRGVLTFADGKRYEGEMARGARNGMGVLWNADGTVAMAGRWENGQLAEPATP